jgi:hypothetical protein
LIGEYFLHRNIDEVARNMLRRTEASNLIYLL